MAVYLCRWPNGDISFVKAKSKDEAIFLLDEVGDAGDAGVVLEVVKDFMVHYRLDGVEDCDDDHTLLSRFQHEEFGEMLWEQVYEKELEASRERSSN